MKPFDEHLYTLKLREPYKWLHAETQARRRKVLFDHRKTGQALRVGLPKLVDSDIGVLREHLTKIDKGCRETWLSDHEAITPAFIRTVLVPHIFTVIAARKGAIQGNLDLLAKRTHIGGTGLTPALHHLVWEIEHLKNDVATQYEIEAVELSKRVAQNLTTTATHSRREFVSAEERRKANPLLEGAILATRNEFEIELRTERERKARAAFGIIRAAIKQEPRLVPDTCPQCGNSSLAIYRASWPQSGWTLKCNPCGWSGITLRLGPHRKEFGYASSLVNAFSEQLRHWLEAIQNSTSIRTFSETVGRIGGANGRDVGWVTAQIETLLPVLIGECQKWAMGACEGSLTGDWQAPIWLRDWPTPTQEEAILDADLRTKRLSTEETAHILDELSTHVRQNFEKLRRLGLDRALIQMAQMSQQPELIAPLSELRGDGRGIERPGQRAEAALETELAQIETKLLYLKQQFPDWLLFPRSLRRIPEAFGHLKVQPPEFCVEIWRLEEERERIILELSKRRKLTTQTEAIEPLKPELPSETGRRELFVRPLLQNKGWSTLDWARESRVDFHTASNYLRGKTMPYQSTLKKLADSLGVSVEKMPG